MIAFRLLVVSFILCCGCKKTNTDTPPPVPPAPEPDIYIGGSLSRPNRYSYGVTWTNGKATVIPDSSITLSISNASSGHYALGASGNYFRFRTQPADQPPAGGKNIAVSGFDVYITYWETYNTAALYWKIGQIVNLTAASGFTYAQSFDIALSGSDVYVSGTIKDFDNTPRAVYWKNGTIHYLAGGYHANFICVSGNDVYVTGNTADGDVYWKNDVAHPVGRFNNITGIAVSGNDVYMSGTSWQGLDPGQAFFIKNDQKTVLPNGAKVYGIAVNRTDVYCSGVDSSNNAVYWKNTEKHILGPEGVAWCIQVDGQH